MAVETLKSVQDSRSLVSYLYEPKVRSVIYQVALVIALLLLFYEIVDNTATNLRKQNVASGFDFLGRTAGFDISQSLITYQNTMSYGRAFLVGLMNTLLVAGIGIVLATVLGFVTGIARLSRNWLISTLATCYVEILRNVPLLLLLLMLYYGVLKNLPGPRQAYAVPGGGWLSVRGLYLPSPVWEPGIGWVLLAVLAGLIGATALAVWARRRQRETGQQFPAWRVGLGMTAVAGLLLFLLLGRPLSFDYPTLQGFNFQGGMTILPEFTALLIGLVIYTASFIAEIVRAGIAGVQKGQKEAAAALGLRQGQLLRLVVIPQAMRIIIPPLTSQYLNLTKNSSLAVAIGYPDLVSVFAGTVLNQTNQAVEVILITMGVYLTLSLLTSGLMNWFNARMALVER
jgi:general L-amino acid transport system permease protein